MISDDNGTDVVTTDPGTLVPPGHPWSASLDCVVMIGDAVRTLCVTSHLLPSSPTTHYHRPLRETCDVFENDKVLFYLNILNIL